MSASWRWLLLNACSAYLRNPLVDKGKWFLLRQLNPAPGVESDWEKYGVRRARTRYGFRMHADMIYASDRSLYFTGEYEPIVSRFIASVLDGSWRFVDIGANVGFYTLLASLLTDDVVSVEPNPVSLDLLQRNLDLNDCRSVSVVPCAFSDETGESILYQSGRNIGGASLIRNESGAVQRRIPVRRGDDVLERSSKPRTLIKIDVEGAEYKVLEGMSDFLAREHVVVVAEITDCWLRDSGASAKMLFDRLRSYDLYPYMMVHPWTWLRTRTCLVPLEHPADLFQYNVCFARREDVRELARRSRSTLGVPLE